MSKDTQPLNNVEFTDETELNRLLDGLAPITPEPGQADSLRASIMHRVSQSIATHAGLLTVRSNHGVWKTLKAGIRYKLLRRSAQGSSVLIEFAPGASLPPHRHNWMEEGIVLCGDLSMGDLQLGSFDYHMSPKGSRHSSICSRQGSLAFLCGSSVGNNASIAQELIGGLLPMGKDHSLTVFTGVPEDWQVCEEGVFKKDLWFDDTRVSRIYRLEAGASIPSISDWLDEEYMILEGELFLGDILLRAGEYQWAPAGSKRPEVFSDVGASLFVRTARADD